MIGYLKGVIFDIEANNNSNTMQLVVDVNNVGYQVLVAQTDLINTKKTGDLIELWIQTIVREDSFSLYGFLEKTEKRCFDDLLSVSGVGPKVALSIISNLGFSGVYEAIRDEDINKLASSQGLGKKGASRIVLELKGKLVLDDDTNTSGDQVNGKQRSELINQVIDALTNLGFKKEVIKQVATDIPVDYSLEQAIKFTLQNLQKP